jgi:hypothetical protein
MSQLINFTDFNLEEAVRKKAVAPSDAESIVTTTHNEIDLEAKYKLTLTILVHNHPGKECFALKEVAAKLGVGEEFIRRRIKSGKIKATYLGDKPIINIVELARIITEGV